MDVDWCLTCEKRVEAPDLYCSLDCRYLAASTSTLLDQDEDDRFVIFHPADTISSCVETTSRWTGNDCAGISAWAAEIPYGPPADPSSSSPSHCIHRPPKLLSRHPQIIPPSLCTVTPRATPLHTPKPRHPTMQPPDISRISLKSALSESSPATPASSHPVPISTIQRPLGLGDIYSHVRSWALTPSHTSPAKVKPLKLTPSARRLSSVNVKVVCPPDTPHGFLDEDALHWKVSTIILEQPPKRAPEGQQRGCRLPHEFPRMADQDSSFRARGRKASRAVA